MLLFDWLTDWLRGLLVDGIMSNLGGLFDTVNARIGEVAGTVGTSPADWHPGVFNMIRTLSETVVLPIAGVILTFLVTYELIQMIIDRNNLNEVDTWMFFKWVFKTFVAVLILSNTFDAVMAVFDMAQAVVNNAGDIIGGSTEVTVYMLDEFRDYLMEMGLFSLIGLWLQTLIIDLTIIALNIVIFIIVYGRMIEIFVLTSLAPIPFATLSNREFSSMGHNYFKSLLAIGFQGFLILVCIAIYAVLVQSIVTSGDPIGAVWAMLGYTVLLCFTLFKTGSVSKAIFGAH